MEQFEQEFDVVVVGSGAGGLTAAWTAARAGLSVLVLEKAAVFGGNSAMSGGAAWMPGSPVLKREGYVDEPEDLFAYLQTIAPDIDPERHRQYIAEIPRLHEALEQLPQFRDGFRTQIGYSDYHVDMGGSARGRGVFPAPVDSAILGDELDHLRGATFAPPGIARKIWFVSRDLEDLSRLRWGFSPRRYLVFARLGMRLIHNLVTGKKKITMGRALIARLRTAIKDLGVPLWLATPMKSLIMRDGAVVGVTAEKAGRLVSIGARKGVIMASGGFEFSEEMRRTYQPILPEFGFSSGAESNTGDGIRAGEAVGAAIDLMDSAWWMPSIKAPHGPQPTVLERQSPNQFMINRAGVRFANEAAPYSDFGRIHKEGLARGESHFPAFLITDHYAWTHNMIGGHMPGSPIPPNWIEHGTLTIADSLEELATKIDVSADALVATAERFNAFARNGRDLDFQRGENEYDHYYGDARLANPNLAEVRQPPFYAIKIGLGDLGTNGGLLTNARAQVLDGHGAVIPGLYATGNCSASIMGYRYAGPGGTIGPAMTFGWIAGNDVAGRHDVGTAQERAPSFDRSNSVVAG